MLKIYPKPRFLDAAEIINGGPVHGATAVRIGSVPLPVPFTIWETLSQADRKTSLSPIHNTAVQNATITSMRTWMIWHCPKVIIPIVWFQWRFGWLLKTACPTVRLHGIYGEIIGSLFRGRRFRTGLRRRGKKAEVTVKTDYIDKALTGFSGYITADELYDGPFCVLFIVDNHHFKRLYYEVLDHNPTNADKHTLNEKEKKKLQRITRGFQQLRALRLIVDEVYRLFDRRCRMDTALEKLAKLRCRVGHFTTLRETLKKLWSPNLEKALTFLDDSLLPATSNAVERANRRHRKMQKSIYRVRTRDHISQRIAMDMQRDLYRVDQKATIHTLHRSRTGEIRKAG